MDKWLGTSKLFRALYVMSGLWFNVGGEGGGGGGEEEDPLRPGEAPIRPRAQGNMPKEWFISVGVDTFCQI